MFLENRLKSGRKPAVLNVVDLLYRQDRLDYQWEIHGFSTYVR
jgi:hypothetical protein